MQKTVGMAEAGRIVDRSLFVVAAGTNDMMNNFYTVPMRKMLTLKGYHDLLLANLESFLKASSFLFIYFIKQFMFCNQLYMLVFFLRVSQLYPYKVILSDSFTNITLRNNYDNPGIYDNH